MSNFDDDFATPNPPPPPRPIEYADADTSGWWISLLGGIALVALGVWVLTNLYESVVVLAWLVGVSLIVAGFVELMALHGTPDLGWAVWLSSGLLIAAGAAVLVWPDITLWALAVLAGLGLLFAGTTRVLVALADRDQPDFSLQLGIGAAGIVLGVLVLVWPDATLVVLALLLGIRFVFTGVVAIGVGWQLHRLAH
ncbi:MAG TPA: DUF308 domain-containing protein [Acidimicrobiales bacterium]|nr:DUF308 domain-containing protein [Acidimicrobiales bacterium]